MVYSPIDVPSGELIKEGVALEQKNAGISCQLDMLLHKIDK